MNTVQFKNSKTFHDNDDKKLNEMQILNHANT